MKTFSNRNWIYLPLALSFLFLATLQLPSDAQAQQRKRKSIDAYTAAELLDYVHAVKKLREKSSTNPSIMYSYAHLAGLHNRPTLFAGACEHWNHRFLAWHRALLLNYEDALRASDPPRTSNVTVPYWNWSIAPTGKRFPVAFENNIAAAEAHYGQLIPQDSLRELHRTNRNTATSLPLYPWDEIAEIAQLPDKVEFAGPASRHGALENPPHDSLHGFIGGDLVSTSTAANDPIFWSYHAFVDLVWWWRQTQVSETPDCMDCAMRGMPVKTALGRVLNTAASQPPLLRHVYDTSVLDYTYDFDVPIITATTMASVKKSKTFSERFATLAEMALRKPDHVWSLPVKPISNMIRPKVILSNVSTPKSFAYIAFIYVHPTGVSFEASNRTFRDQYLVGHYSQWVNEHSQHAEHEDGPATDREFVVQFEPDAYPTITQQQSGEIVVSIAIHVQAEVAATATFSTASDRAAVLQVDTRVGSAAIR